MQYPVWTCTVPFPVSAYHPIHTNTVSSHPVPAGTVLHFIVEPFKSALVTYNNQPNSGIWGLPTTRCYHNSCNAWWWCKEGRPSPLDLMRGYLVVHTNAHHTIVFVSGTAAALVRTNNPMVSSVKWLTDPPFVPEE